MSNSSLATYTLISPNRTTLYSKVNTVVTVHCTVGQRTAADWARYFNNSSVQASCNYAIGYDGSIALVVEEKDRSWCTGGEKTVNGITGRDNDFNAITIEVSSDTYAPYKVTDAAYKALVKLLADICKRNPKIGRLKWQANPALVGNTSAQNMTAHRWFAYKECPGDYLYSRFGQIAKEVNAILDGGQPTPTPTPSKKPDIYYRVRVGSRWLPEVKNLEDYAGNENQIITGLAVKISDGSGIKYRVHNMYSGWLPYVTGYNINDFDNGYAGNGGNIDCIEIVGTKYKIEYRVSPTGSTGYYSYQIQNSTAEDMDGYAGVYGRPIDKVQIVCV